MVRAIWHSGDRESPCRPSAGCTAKLGAARYSVPRRSMCSGPGRCCRWPTCCFRGSEFPRRRSRRWSGPRCWASPWRSSSAGCSRSGQTGLRARRHWLVARQPNVSRSRGAITCCWRRSWRSPRFSPLAGCRRFGRLRWKREPESPKQRARQSPGSRTPSPCCPLPTSATIRTTSISATAFPRRS